MYSTQYSVHIIEIVKITETQQVRLFTCPDYILALIFEPTYIRPPITGVSALLLRCQSVNRNLISFICCFFFSFGTLIHHWILHNPKAKCESNRQNTGPSLLIIIMNIIMPNCMYTSHVWQIRFLVSLLFFSPVNIVSLSRIFSSTLFFDFLFFFFIYHLKST